MKRLLLLLLIAFPLFLFAQPEAADDDFPNPPGESPLSDDKLETIMIARLTRLLDIKTEQAKLFFPLLSEFERKTRDLRKERIELAVKLRRLGEPGSSSTALEVDRVSKTFMENHRLQAEAIKVFVTATSKVLEPWQVARLQLFIMRFPERVEQLMRERMGRGAPKGGQNRHRGGRGQQNPPEIDPFDDR
ncbi:MAG: hypothetical protein OEM52_13230 [bacterium]|nr:hypothetical protein [bacterium]